MNMRKRKKRKTRGQRRRGRSEDLRTVDETLNSKERKKERNPDFHDLLT